MSISAGIVFSGESKYWYAIYIKEMKIIMGHMVKCRITLDLFWETISTIFKFLIIKDVNMSVPQVNQKKVHL